MAATTRLARRPTSSDYYKSFELLEYWAASDPKRRAIGCDGEWITFGEWWRRAEQVADGLSNDQSPVGLIFDSTDGIEFAVAYVASHLAKRPALVLNPRLSQLEKDFQLDDAGVGIVLTGYGAADSNKRSRPAGEPLIDSSGEVIADILYSSGTTGTAKGILTTHRGLWVSAWLLADYTYGGTRDRIDDSQRLTSRDTLVTALPVCSAASSIGFINCGLVTGAALHYMSRFAADRFTSFMRDVSGTVFYGAPSFFALWRGAEPNAEPAARNYTTIGAPVPTSLAAWVADCLGDRAHFVNCYGLTEGNGATLIAIDQELIDHPGAIGKTLPGVDARIIDEDGRDSDEGELLIRAEGMMEGYLNRPDATARTLVDGWLHTGDLVANEAGIVCIRGRRVERINRGGYKIFPSEIEEIVTAIEGVLDAVAVAVPHDVLGEDIALAVEVPLGGGSPSLEAKIHQALQAQLADFKVPRRVRLVDRLPRSTLGKVVRSEVSAWFKSPDPPPTLGKRPTAPTT